MPRLSVMGHPVHPILQAIPAAVLPASTTFDALAYLSDSESLSEAGRYSPIFGLLGGVGAGATGILDYYEIENRSVRRVALYHGLCNAALLTSYLASLRRRGGSRVDGKALLLSILGASLVGLSGYLGGSLVYDHGVRVGEDHVVVSPAVAAHCRCVDRTSQRPRQRCERMAGPEPRKTGQ